MMGLSWQVFGPQSPDAVSERCQIRAKRKTLIMESLIKKSDRWLSKRSLGGIFAALAVGALRGFSAHSGQPTPLSDDPTVIRAEFQKYADHETVPKKVDEITTLTAVHFDGRTLAYSYEINAATEAAGGLSEQNAIKRICDSEGRVAVAKGFAFHFDYFHTGTKVASYTVASCPAAAPAAPVSVDQTLAYSYDIIGDRIIIHAKGVIGANEADALNAWWATLPPHAASHMRVGTITLSLDSPGGMIDGATHLKGWVEENKVDTVVANGSTCASACVAIWGAGWHKTVGVDARIGVHSASATVPMSDDERAATEAVGTVVMARTLADEKAPPAVIAAVTTTDKTDVHWLTSADVVAWGGVMLDKDGTPTQIGPLATAPKAAPVELVQAITPPAKTRPTQVDPPGLY
jgi:hypothetical protein